MKIQQICYVVAQYNVPPIQSVWTMELQMIG